MTFVLGLNAHHADAAACLVKDGELIAAGSLSRSCGHPMMGNGPGGG